MRKRMEGSLHKNHEDHLSRYTLVRKYIPLTQAIKIPDAKAAVESGKNSRNTGMAADESQ